MRMPKRVFPLNPARPLAAGPVHRKKIKCETHKLCHTVAGSCMPAGCCLASLCFMCSVELVGMCRQASGHPAAGGGYR